MYCPCNCNINLEAIFMVQTVADVAQQTTKVIDEAKPIATSTVETISSSDPVKIVGAGGVLFLAYLLLPPIFSAISLSFRGYKGNFSASIDLRFSQFLLPEFTK